MTKLIQSQCNSCGKVFNYCTCPDGEVISLSEDGEDEPAHFLRNGHQTFQFKEVLDAES